MEIGVYGVHFPPFEVATGAAVGGEAIVKLLFKVKGIEAATGSGVTTLVTEGLST